MNSTRYAHSKYCNSFEFETSSHWDQDELRLNLCWKLSHVGSTLVQHVFKNRNIGFQVSLSEFTPSNVRQRVSWIPVMGKRSSRVANHILEHFTLILTKCQLILRAWRQVIVSDWCEVWPEDFLVRVSPIWHSVKDSGALHPPQNTIATILDYIAVHDLNVEVRIIHVQRRILFTVCLFLSTIFSAVVDLLNALHVTNF